MSNILDYGKENILEFIQTSIKKYNNIKEDILDKMDYVEGAVKECPRFSSCVEGDVIEDYSSRGFYYERLWDLCIKFGVTDLTLPSKDGHLQTSHIINENPNKTNIEFQSNCWNGSALNKMPDGYLQQKVRSGNSGGYSDITFFNKLDKTEELYFISVKYFKKEKEISKYDIGKLCALIREHEKPNRIIKLYIFVSDKQKAIEKFNEQHSSSNILIKYINPGGKYEHIYDLNDLQNFYFKLKKLLEQYNYLETPDNIIDFETNYLKVLKRIFIPRFHQDLFIRKINKLIENDEKNILVGAIPRSGKSFIMAGTILEYVKKNERLNPGKKLKFLMMTPAPNETFNEYQDIFNNYIEFQQLNIGTIPYTSDVLISDITKKCNSHKHCVIIISKQKLGWKDSKAEKLLAIEDGEDTQLSENIEDGEDEPTQYADDDKYIKTIKTRITQLFGEIPDINVMFLDEAHFGMSTPIAQKIVDTLNSVVENTVKVYVTATYNKPLREYTIKPDCKLTWDMNDIKIMQTLTNETINDNDNPIKKQFGTDIYSETLEYFGDKTGLSLVDKLKGEYAMYPKPYLITSIWDKEFLNVEKLKLGDTDFGWDMNKLFETTRNSDIFENNEQIKEMMCYYFGYPYKRKEAYDKQKFYRKRGILPRIRNICLNKCRTLQPQHKTTQLWFLPVGSGKIINKVKALINLLTTANEFKDINTNYHFFVAVDIENKAKKGNRIGNVTYMNNPREIKKDIENTEKKIKDGIITENNLIILAGNRLQLGISLRNVDIVTLWNSTSSEDAIFQMLFRSMTEVESMPCEKKNEYCPQKKFGFMVDMNPQRTLTNVSLFSENMTKKTDNESDVKKYRKVTDLINIDEDVLHDKYGDTPTDDEMDLFVSELFNKLYASWNKNVENMKKIFGKFSYDMDKLNELRETIKKINLAKQEKVKPTQEPTEEESITSGKSRSKVEEKKEEETEEGQKKDTEGAPEEEKPKKKEKEINIKEFASELLSEFITLLNIFTLYLDTGSKCILIDDKQINKQIAIIDDIIKLKEKIYNDEKTKNVFLKILNGRLTGNIKEIYDEIIIDKLLDSINTSTDKLMMNKIIMSQKKQYYTIHEPDELLVYIDSQLKPKEKEKKDNGEVFTPLWLVEEMLNKLDEAYKKEYGKSIFTEKNFKWFDPAVGIGNFPIILYKKLMEGLKPIITDEEERRKHILENMIYASELTPKNVFIYKKIFCGDKYKKLNIYEGDTLKMDVKKEFKLPADFVGFDVVMGNPPFSYQVGEAKKQALWHVFVEYSLKNCNTGGYLLLVHPSGWRSPEGDFKKVLDLIMSKNLNYLSMNDFKKGKEVFKVGTNFDYYVLHNLFTPNNITSITDIDGKTYEKNINNWKFIPSGGFDLYEKILAKDGEERVNVLYDSTLYETRKDYTSLEESDVYKYPCVYSITQRNDVKCYYSSIKYPPTKNKIKKDMFVPKVIWSNGLGTYPFIDVNGDYCLTQFSYAIIDDVNNLKNIETALNNPKFIELMEYVKFQNNKYNYKVISLLKKDFWNVFLDYKDKIESKKTPIKMDKKTPIKMDKKIELDTETETEIKIKETTSTMTDEELRKKLKEIDIGLKDKVISKWDTKTLEKEYSKRLNRQSPKVIEAVSIPAEVIKSPIQKKRTYKKLPKLKLVQSSVANKVDPLTQPTQGGTKTPIKKTNKKTNKKTILKKKVNTLKRYKKLKNKSLKKFKK